MALASIGRRGEARIYARSLAEARALDEAPRCPDCSRPWGWLWTYGGGSWCDCPSCATCDEAPVDCRCPGPCEVCEADLTAGERCDAAAHLEFEAITEMKGGSHV